MLSQICKQACLCFVWIVLCVIDVKAQPDNPNRGLRPANVPIGGIEVILFVGALFGAAKIYHSHRKSK